MEQLEELGKLLPRATEESVEVVYVAQEEGERGYCKIGHTTRAGVQRRVRGLQTGNPRQIVVRVLLDGGMWLEQALHEHFADARMLGEWFHPEPLRDWFPEVA
jgi:hypothetical protein